MATKKVATRKRVPVKRVIRVAEKEEFEMPVPHVHAHATAVPLMLYRRIALAFIVVVAAVLLVVMYLSTMQAVIHVKPVAKDFSSDLIVHTALTPIDETDIRGIVISGTMNKTKTFAPSGEGAKQVEGKSAGTVTFSNKTNTPQALVATTRLLSSGNVLFRLDKSVVVPAGGSIDAVVHADKVGVTGDVAAGHFIIPGLNTIKQTQIFADSKVAFTGGVQSVAVVSKVELQKSVDALKEEITNDAKDMLRTQAGKGFDGEVFAADITNQKSSIQPDTESKSYDVTETVTITGVFYDRAALKQLFSQHLYDGLGQGQDFAGTKVDDMQVTIDQYDSVQKVASLHAHLDGKMIITRTNKALDVGRFVGMSADDVSKTLVGNGVAESVKVDFFPFWLNKIPRLKDHIYIEFN
ncbi:MAG: hypothetical protein NTX72_05585 [Candidatus Uhrbacteria bacterium]|nr:hypothetical protein [Candidatus Uhrbacteria bacterium]